MSEELDNLMNAINHVNSTFLSYKTIFDGFVLNERVELGGGAYGKCVYKNSKYIVIRLFVPKDGIINTFHHDCKEETKIIYGKMRETVLGVPYDTFKKITVPKERPHGFLALEDCLSYSILYNPNESKS